eukprot:TRINITY_DN33564_c0_g1_i1.p1 TRINITY_DN33564_c0_g1~~TRINITY_DN33564_c0_g1_i1.p1  ORF type:complete len:1809 (+),score=334.40 TRINITY_DN33564_c0_g1_i1:35-5461(+)
MAGCGLLVLIWSVCNADSSLPALSTVSLRGASEASSRYLQSSSSNSTSELNLTSTTTQEANAETPAPNSTGQNSSIFSGFDVLAQVNTSNSTVYDSGTRQRSITRAEVMGLIFAGLAFLSMLLVHALFAPALYCPDLIMAALFSGRLGDKTFSRFAPPLQWIILGTYLVPVAFIAVAAQQVAAEQWRVASLGSLVALALYAGSFGLGRAASDSFVFSWTATVHLLIAALLLAAFFGLFVCIIPPFSFVGTSVVMLCLSAVPSVCLAFLHGPWQGTAALLKLLQGEIAEVGEASALPRQLWRRYTVDLSLWLLSLGTLGAYGFAVYTLHPNSAVRMVGFVLSGAVIVLDLLVWYLWSLGLVTSAAQTAVLMVAARVAACVWGEKYWLMGHSGVFLAMCLFLIHVVVDLVIPSPDSPQVRRKRLAAQMLDTLQKKVSAGEPEATSSEVAETDGHTVENPDVLKRSSLPCWRHPAWILVVLLICFLAEVGAVTFAIEEPDISLCSSCDARPQYLYALIALCGAFVYGVSLIAFRKAQNDSFGKKGPLLETAPLPLALAFLCWIGASVYTSWVVDSWSVSVHVSFLPLIIGLYLSGHHRWAADDFNLKPPHSQEEDGKVAPAPDSPSGSAATEKDASTLDAGSSTDNQTCLKRLQKIPWALRIWVVALILDGAYAGTLHAVLDEQNRWTGWTIAAAVLVLALTFMSNRLWFGTFRIYPEQPILWTCIPAIIILWAGLVWALHGKLEVDHFGLGLLSAVVFYPISYLGLLAFQVLRDAKWKLSDDATKRFVRNVLIVCTSVYIAYFAAIAYWFWPVALCALCFLTMVAALGLAGWTWVRNNRFISPRVKLWTGVALAVCILVAAVGITVFFQSIFGGFTTICVGIVLLLGIGASIDILENRQRTEIEQLRVGSSNLVFPMFRLSAGNLVPAQRDLLSILAALMTLTIWGLVAAAAQQEFSAPGMVAGVLAIMAALVLVMDLISQGGIARARVLAELSEAQLLVAAKDAMEAAPEAAMASVEEKSEKQEATRDALVKALQAYSTECTSALESYKNELRIACCGRFHTIFLISFWQTLNAGVSLCRSGRGGCVMSYSPEEPQGAHAKLKAAALAYLASIQRQQRFGARLQLCLFAARARRLWGKESEFRAFLQSFPSVSKGLTLEDFKQLPPDSRHQIEDEWQKWKVAEALRAQEEEKRRKEEEEAARKRKEEQRRRKEEARTALATAMSAETFTISSLLESIQKAKQFGWSDHDVEMANAKQKLKELQDAEKLLQSALAITDETPGQLAKLQEAALKAVVAGLDGDLLEQTRQAIARVQGAISAEEEAERKRREEEQRKKLEEEARRKKKEDEERRRKEEEERMKKGLPKVVAANLEKLKELTKDSDYVDEFFTLEWMGDEAAKYELKTFREIAGRKVHLFEDSFEPNDIHQGGLGDCWFLSAIACMCTRPDLLKKVFIYSDEDKGLYVVRFYKSGVYQDVVVDDFFPCKGRATLAFAESGNQSEAWVQVLEKAYAKLHGSYDAIVGGFVNDALVDMTGGMGQSIRLTTKESKKEIDDGTMWSKLKGFMDDGHLMGAGSSAGSDTDISDKGIVFGHAYSILRLEDIDGHQLVKMRNPWGGTEWTGKWSDGDTESWTQRLKVKLDYVKADDGSFWIAFQDFVIQYRNVYICRVFGEGWNRQFVSSEWKGATAGGCANYDTYKNNPKIQLKVKGRVRILLALEQADSRGVEGEDDVPIGFKVFKHGHDSGRGLCSTGSYSYDREVWVDTELAENSEGPHCIIPSTFKPNMERRFLMKVFWKGDTDAIQMYKEEGAE